MSLTVMQLSFLAVLLTLRRANGFLSGAPKVKGNPVGSNRGNQPQVDVESCPPPIVEDAPYAVAPATDTSPFSCEVLYVGDVAVRGKSKGLCFDANLTQAQARAIAVEAATSNSVPKDTIRDALHYLAYYSVRSRSSGDASPAHPGALNGVWRLCFSEELEFLPGLQVDRHGYINRNQQVDLRFDTQSEELVMGTKGLDASVPEIMKADLAYWPDQQTVTGTFNQEMVDLDPVVMQACLIDEDALGFSTISTDGNMGFLLFRAETSRAAALNLRRAATLSPAKAAAKEAAGVAIAGKNKIQLPIELKAMMLLSEQDHEEKRAGIEERGNRLGGFRSWMRYLETEGPVMYAVLAGPVLLSFFKLYTPIATSKAMAAATIIGETLNQVMDVQA